MAQRKKYDRVRNLCSTSGTGALTLGDQATGSQSIKARMSTGDIEKFYFVKGSQNLIFEGTFTAPDQLARTRIIDGSGGVATNVDFAVGVGEVGMGVSAEDLDVLNLIETTVTCATTIDLGGTYAKYVLLSGTTGPVAVFSNMTNKERIVRHSGETITHHATTMILIGAVSYVTSADDISCFKGDASGNVREIWRRYASGRVVSASDGTVSLPAFTFQSDLDSGLYRIGANNIGVAVNGAKVVDVGTAGVGVTGILNVTGTAINLGSGGTGVSNSLLNLQAGSGTGSGPGIVGYTNGVPIFGLSTHAAVFGTGTSTDTVLYGFEGAGICFRANNTTGAVSFNAVGTTASSANAFLDGSNVNNLLRSTSSLLYKEAVEPIEDKYVDAVVSLNPIWYRSKAPADRKEWSWYGLAAEEVAAVDARLVHWIYPDDAWETIETEETVSVPDTEEVEEIIAEILVEEARAVEKQIVRSVSQQKQRVVPLFSERGEPIMIEHEDGTIVQDDGSVVPNIVLVQKTVAVPLTREETRVRSERKLKPDAMLVPDGVMYDRVAVLLLEKMKRDAKVCELQAVHIAKLDERLKALES